MIEFNIDWVQVLTFVIAIVLPLLVGLVTKLVTHPSWRAVLLALFSAVLGLLSELLQALTTQTAFDLGAALLTWLGIFVVAVASHFGFWKPTGVANSAQAVGTDKTTIVRDESGHWVPKV